jgi:hypothetical protein
VNDAIDLARLAELKTVITRGLATFIEVGNALIEVRDARLYRAENATFEEWCQAQFGIGRAQAYRLIDASAIAGVLSPNGDIPANEAQIRELAPLADNPELLRQTWEKIQAGGEPVTAKVIKAAVSEAQRDPLDERLALCEAQTERNVEQVRASLEALLEVRDRHLYREEYKTFHDYCLGRWGKNYFELGRSLWTVKVDPEEFVLKELRDRWLHYPCDECGQPDWYTNKLCPPCFRKAHEANIQQVKDMESQGVGHDEAWAQVTGTDVVELRAFYIQAEMMTFVSRISPHLYKMACDRKISLEDAFTATINFPDKSGRKEIALALDAPRIAELAGNSKHGFSLDDIFEKLVFGAGSTA